MALRRFSNSAGSGAWPLSAVAAVCTSMVALALSVAAPARAADAGSKWPDRPLRLVVPYTPGGGTDGVSRTLAEKTTADTKWLFVVDNKPGAGGNIGLDQVAKAKDGLTIGMGQTSNMAINPALLPSMPFDPAKDLKPVIVVAGLPMILVVKADSPYRSVNDIVAAAKAHPGDIKQALAGTGTVGHLCGEMLSQRAGVKVLNVPYKGAIPAITDLLGGQTDYMFSTPQGAMEMIKSKRLRAIAVSSARRMPILPDVPTVAESGFAGFEVTDWKAVVAPASMPAADIEKLNVAFNVALKRADTIDALAVEGSTPIGGSVDKAGSFVASEQKSWLELIRKAGIKLE